MPTLRTKSPCGVQPQPWRQYDAICIMILSRARRSTQFGAPIGKECSMFTPTAVFADAFGKHLAGLYDRAYSRREARYGEMICEAARLVFEQISLRRRSLPRRRTYRTRHPRRTGHPSWGSFEARCVTRGLAALYSRNADPRPGYIRGVCRGDRNGAYVIGAEGGVVSLERGASDASLAPYHIERSKIAVRERFGSHPIINAERIARAIELTRIPGAGRRRSSRNRYRGRSGSRC